MSLHFIATTSRVSPPQAFCAIGFLFGLNEVARDLEDPFTTELGYWLGANRLHAPLMQTHFDARLLSLGSEASRAEWPTELSACYARTSVDGEPLHSDSDEWTDSDDSDDSDDEWAE